MEVKLRRTSILLYLIALFIIAEGPTVWHYTTPVILNVNMNKIILYVLCIVYVLKNRTLLRKGLKIGAFFLVYLFIYLLGARQGMNRSINFTFNMIIPFFIYPLFCSTLIHKKECNKLLKAYADVMIFFAAVSVVCWVFGTQLNVLPFRKETTYIWAGGVRRTAYTYLNLYYETNLQVLTTSLINLGNLNRNVGIFCEAPGYALYLDCALAIELLANPKIDKKRVIILILASITSFSTKSYVFIVMIFFLRVVFITKKDNQYKWAFLITSIPFILVLVFATGITLVSDKLGTGSGTIRLDDLQAGLMTLRKSPVWGSGFYDNTMILSFTSVKRNNQGLSMGTTFLAHGGLYIMSLYLGAIFAVFASKALKPYKKEFIIFTVLILFEFASSNVGESHIFLMMVSMAYTFLLAPESKAVQLSPEPAAERRQGIRLVWKLPIWLDEDNGEETGIREENVSFAVFDTLIRRSVGRPADLLRIMEQNDPRVPEHFAEKRVEAERAAFAKLGVHMGLADIYEELLPLYGAHTNDLMALEIQYEIAGCRPVPENIDLVNLCMEHDKNVFLIADTYLPSSVIRRMLDVCGVYHYDRLYVSCEEGACKADGSLFWKVLADQEIRPHELRHIGSDRQGDIVEPWRVGVHVKRGKKKDLSTVEKELPEDIALYERTLQSCVRNCEDDLDSADARLGCETFGPLLAGFTAWLWEQLRRDGIQDVYFLAGDGAVLKQAFDALEDGAFRTHSLYFPAQTVEQDHEALVAYLRACGMQGRVALVDTGRQAIVQKTLENLIAEAGLNIQVKGYYVGLADTDGMQAAGYLYDQDKGKETLEKLSPITVLFDTIFHAQHGAVRRIAMRDGQPVPELDDSEYASDEGRICDEIAILRAYQAGAIELVREMNTAFPGGVPQIPGEAAILTLLRMGTKPTLQEVELWGDFRVFDKGTVTLMARPKGKGAYLLHPGQLKRDYVASPWKIGFLRRISRLPLAYDKIVKNR